MTTEAGINGFGRFGLHLLKYWLDRNNKTCFKISYINDDSLDIRMTYDLIVNDKSVIFNKYKVQILGDFLIFLEPNGNKHEIYYTNHKQKSIPWLGRPEIFFECSGKYTEAKKSSFFLKGKTDTVLISATSWDSEKTLVYGYNHEDYERKLKIISYGSCTVNAYVPFAEWINKKYGIVDSDVNVIHNIQEYRLKDNNTLNRKFCTLEKSATLLMDFITKENFTVNYSVIPYTGVSLIDFRFRIKKSVDIETLINDLSNEISHGVLENLYGLDEIDIGPEIHNCTIYSTVLIKESIKTINGNIYFQGYFDNENSVNRFYDLANYICDRAETDIK
jgi:glyceraldehyde 3-phosphate dehydrogenase